MEFTQARRECKYLTAEEEERVGVGSLPFHTASSSSPSSTSPVVLHWDDGSDPSVSIVAPPAADVEKEQMFEKVVTPSDVGKLNRLVIPKQHAEKYFPLDASSNDKGLLLNFEDRNGKPWRFRYSYWNSSQSYVMTKGWSRFVKEKQLDAGDTVTFGRGMGEDFRDRLFIDWKRRPDQRFDLPASLRIPRFAYHPYPSTTGTSAGNPNPYQPYPRSSGAPWVGRFFVPHAPTTTTSAANYFYFRSPQPGQQPECGSPKPMVLDSFPVAHAKPASVPKMVRLFGVNLEQPCDAAEDDSNVDKILTSNSSTGLLQLHSSRAHLPSPDLLLSGNRSSSSSSSSRGWKDRHFSPSLDLDK